MPAHHRRPHGGNPSRTHHEKLDIHSIAGLTWFAIQQGLVSLMPITSPISSAAAIARGLSFPQETIERRAFRGKRGVFILSGGGGGHPHPLIRDQLVAGVSRMHAIPDPIGGGARLPAASNMACNFTTGA